MAALASSSSPAGAASREHRKNCAASVVGNDAGIATGEETRERCLTIVSVNYDPTATRGDLKRRIKDWCLQVDARHSRRRVALSRAPRPSA